VIGILGSSELIRIFFFCTSEIESRNSTEFSNIFLMKLDYFETPVCAVRVSLWFGSVRLVTCVCSTSSILFRKFDHKNNSVLLSAVWFSFAVRFNF
jgi:hypothetical protein